MNPYELNTKKGDKKASSFIKKDISELTCKKCNKLFQWKNALELHMRNHDVLACTCKICGKVSDSLRQLHFHLRSAHPIREKPYHCIKCPRTYETPYTLKAHMKDHEGVTFKCHQCSATYKHANSLRNHLQRKHSGHPLRSCEKCGRSFQTLEAFDAHMSHHEGEKAYQCQKCQLKYWSVANLRRHWKMTGHGISAADSLPTTFTKDVMYADTVKVSTKVKDDNNICLHSTEIKTKLKVKKKVCKGAYLKSGHSCTICMKMFQWQSKLQQHMRVHEAETHHSCKVCFKTFNTSKAINSHMRAHVNLESKKFECKLCEKKYTTKFHLEAHEVKAHSKEPLNETFWVICSICDRKFKTHKTLYVHQKLHEGIGPFTCSTCDVAYYCQRGLNSHLRSSWHQLNLKKI